MFTACIVDNLDERLIVFYVKDVFCDATTDNYDKTFIYTSKGVFEAFQEPDWITAEPFKDIISDIDNSDILAPGVLYQREHNVTYAPEHLAGGTRMLLLMYHLHHMGLVFDLTACGENCAKWLPSITNDRDIIARVGYPMPICPTEEWPVLCLNNNFLMKSRKDFLDREYDFCYTRMEDVVLPEGFKMLKD